MVTPLKFPVLGVACVLANRVMLPLPLASVAPLFARMSRVVDACRLKAPKLELPLKVMAPAPKNSIGTPLRIPYGNKDVALKLGARYGSEGWYAPPGVDLSAFGERGWLL